MHGPLPLQDTYEDQSDPRTPGKTSLPLFNSTNCPGDKAIQSFNDSMAKGLHDASSNPSTSQRPNSYRKASIVSLIHMLSHPLLSTPKTDLDLPRFPCRIQLSTQQPTTYQGFSVTYSVAYSYLHNSPRPVSPFSQTCSNWSNPSVQPQTACKSFQYGSHSSSPSL